MTARLLKPRVPRRHLPVFSTLVVFLASALGIGLWSVSPANADASVYTLVQNVPESWGPYWNYSSFAGAIDTDTAITISCYLTGDTVSGPYGSENVWDEVSGAPYNQEYTGTFVPDAYIYTGSNSPVVPRCATGQGTTIGGVPTVSGVHQVPIENGPGGSSTVVDYVNLSVNVEITCYATGSWVTGPYGPENIWDLTTRTYPSSAQWVSDAYVYTGSNAPIVPHC